MTETVFDRGTRHRIVTVGECTEPMHSDTPMAVIAEKRFEEVPDPFAIIVPGGGIASLKAMGNERILNYLRRGHLERLAELRDQAGDARVRLEAVLEAYALIQHKRHATELAALLHRDEHVAQAQQQLTDIIRELLAEAAQTGDVRGDIAPDELASYCLYALAAASSLPSDAAVRRLVTVTLAGLRPPR